MVPFSHPEIPPPGMVLAGKYRVDAVIGVGGMGMVLAAQHVVLGKPVAVKLLRPHMFQSAHAVERFLREARAASAIESEHVARVLDFGRLDDGAPFMALELLSGEDLAQRLAREGPLSASTVVGLVLQACEALAEAHALGMVHRDLKPANLFVCHRRDGTELVKVLDFGITKLTGDAVHLTHSSAMMGSPLYMSPEQLANASRVDARCDIWALGVLLYELTQGRAPFLGGSLAEVGIAIREDPPPPMLHVPAAFAAVVARCLAKDPRMRPQDVGALAVALASLPGAPAAHLEAAQKVVRTLVPSSRQAASHPAAVAGPPEARAASTTGASASDSLAVHQRRRSRARWGMLAAGALVMWAVLAWFTNRYFAPTATASTPMTTTAGPRFSTTPMTTPTPALRASDVVPPSHASGEGKAASLPSTSNTVRRPADPPSGRRSPVRSVSSSLPSTSPSAAPVQPRGALGLGSPLE